MVSTLALRVLSFFFAALLVISFGASGLANLAQWLDVGQYDPQSLERLFGGDQEIEPVFGLWLRAATLPFILWLAWLFAVRLDGASAASIGLRRPQSPGTDALVGCLAAALTLMIWFLGILPLTESEVRDWTPAQAVDPGYLPLGLIGLLEMTFLFLMIAVQDELIFRGYIFSTFRERLTWVHAAGMTNLLAVGLYAGHPDIGSAGLLNVFLLGMALAAMREKTGSLWMPALFAGFWNIILGCVLSLPISGILYPRLFSHRLEGSENLTGGAYGPEGSWVLAGLLLLLVLSLAAWTERQSLREDVEELGPNSESN